MWVAQLGCHVEAEVAGVLDGGVSQLDTDGATLFEGLFEQQRLQDRVQLLRDVLKQNLNQIQYINQSILGCVSLAELFSQTLSPAKPEPNTVQHSARGAKYKLCWWIEALSLVI